MLACVEWCCTFAPFDTRGQTMRRIIYSLLRDGTGRYEMRIGAILLGLCIKIGREYYFTPAEALGMKFEVRKRSTQGLKEEIESLLPDILWERVDGISTKDHYFTIFEAQKFAGLSHSEVRTLLREINEFHRYLKRNEYGDFLVRRAMENQAEFKWGHHARIWLAENPNKGNYKPISPEQWAIYAKKMHALHSGEEAA